MVEQLVHLTGIAVGSLGALALVLGAVLTPMASDVRPRRRSSTIRSIDPSTRAGWLPDEDARPDEVLCDQAA
jgi:hypothetical protein